MLGETKNQFSLIRATTSTCGRKQSNFLLSVDRDFSEEKDYEGALNVYGYSRQLFDNYVRRLCQDAEAHGETLPQITGFRYFNVYGPREQHKGSMASVAFHLNEQLSKGEKS